MWKCPKCGGTVDDQIELCWTCQEPKPPASELAGGAGEPPPDWAGNFRETAQPDGTVRVEAFGRELSCAVCGNATFRERSSLMNTKMLTFFNLDWANKAATNFICSRCGYVFWFLPQ